MFILPIMDIECCRDYIEKEIEKEYIYVLKNNKILKLHITIDEQILIDNFINIYNVLVENLFCSFEIVGKKELEKLNFPISMPCVGKLKFNKFRKQDAYKIPGDDSNTTLFYLINDIYNNNLGKNKNIKEEHLYGLNYEFFCYSEEDSMSFTLLTDAINKALSSIISNLNIELIESYDYEQFVSSLNYIELVRNKERLWSKINLSKLKSILTSAEKNSEVFDNMGIQISESKEKTKVNKNIK